MSKIQYVVGSGRTQKLKRNVPKDLQAIAGKTVWVARISNVSIAAAKEKARFFGIRTDDEIAKLQARKVQLQQTASMEVTSLELTEEKALQIASSYLRDRDDQCFTSGAYFLDVPELNITEFLSEAYNDVKIARRALTGIECRTDPMVIKLLQDRGLLASSSVHRDLLTGWPTGLEQHRVFQLLCTLIEKADLAIAERRFNSLKSGTVSPLIADWAKQPFGANSTATNQSNASQYTYTIANLIEAYKNNIRDGVSTSRLSQHEIAFRALTETFGGHEAISFVTRIEARKIYDFLPTIPAYVTRHFRGQTLAEAAKSFASANGKSESRLKEAGNHLGVLKAIFRFAVAEGWVEKNPFDNLKYKSIAKTRRLHAEQEATYEPFTIEELNKIFAVKLFSGSVDDAHGFNKPGPKIVRRHRYWVPIIGLWSGMRMNEILQLEKADICLTDTGVAYFNITDADNGGFDGSGTRKRVKNKNSIRKMPVSPVLIDMGFLDWVNDQKGRLFPEASIGAASRLSGIFSKKFATMTKVAGVWESRKKVFHSFRNNFNDALRRADVRLEYREAINGWNSQKSMDQNYGSGHTVEVLFREISKISYPGLDMSIFNKPS